MAGVLYHLLAGSALALIGRYYYNTTFDGEHRLKERLYLIGTCLFLSVFPDMFIGLKIFFGTETMQFHLLLHVIALPISVFFLLMLHFYIDIKDEPIMVMGFISIVLHIILDYFVEEIGMFL